MGAAEVGSPIPALAPDRLREATITALGRLDHGGGRHRSARARHRGPPVGGRHRARDVPPAVGPGAAARSARADDRARAGDAGAAAAFAARRDGARTVAGPKRARDGARVRPQPRSRRERGRAVGSPRRGGSALHRASRHGRDRRVRTHRRAERRASTTRSPQPSKGCCRSAWTRPVPAGRSPRSRPSSVASSRSTWSNGRSKSSGRTHRCRPRASPTCSAPCTGPGWSSRRGRTRCGSATRWCVTPCTRCSCAPSFRGGTGPSPGRSLRCAAPISPEGLAYHFEQAGDFEPAAGAVAARAVSRQVHSNTSSTEPPQKKKARRRRAHCIVVGGEDLPAAVAAGVPARPARRHERRLAGHAARSPPRHERLTALAEPFVLSAAPHPDGWVVGTGNSGKVLLVGRDGKVKELFATAEPEVFAVWVGRQGHRLRRLLTQRQGLPLCRDGKVVRSAGWPFRSPGHDLHLAARSARRRRRCSSPPAPQGKLFRVTASSKDAAQGSGRGVVGLRRHPRALAGAAARRRPARRHRGRGAHRAAVDARARPAPSSTPSSPRWWRSPSAPTARAARRRWRRRRARCRWSAPAAAPGGGKDPRSRPRSPAGRRPGRGRPSR